MAAPGNLGMLPAGQQGDVATRQEVVNNLVEARSRFVHVTESIETVQEFVGLAHSLILHNQDTAEMTHEMAKNTGDIAKFAYKAIHADIKTNLDGIETNLDCICANQDGITANQDGITANQDGIKAVQEFVGLAHSLILHNQDGIKALDAKVEKLDAKFDKGFDRILVCQAVCTLAAVAAVGAVGAIVIYRI